MGDATDPAAEWAAVCAAWSEAGREGTPWRAGMLCVDTIASLPLHRWGAGASRYEPPPSPRYAPDPEDPATLGCLLGLAREVWGVSHAFLYYDQTRGLWCFAMPRGVDEDGEEWVVDVAFAPTEYAALCRAVVAGLRRSQPVNTT